MITRITIESPFRIAMLKSIENKHSLGRYGSQVKQAAIHDVGKRSVSGWNAHLSFRTAEKLKAQHIL